MMGHVMFTKKNYNLKEVKKILKIVVITWAGDADNSPNPRAQPEDECYYCHNIQGNAL